MARKKIQDMIEELRSWLPNYDHKDYPTTLFRLLASLPGGEELEDMGYEPMPGISWHEADQLGRVLEAIQDKSDVEDLVAGLTRDEEEVGERRRPAMHAADRWEVIIGNIGTVYNGSSQVRARHEYDSAVALSKSGRGRAGGESVVLMKNGEPVAEHEGTSSMNERRPAFARSPRPLPRRR